jgi:putative endonuclease
VLRRREPSRSDALGGTFPLLRETTAGEPIEATAISHFLSERSNRNARTPARRIHSNFDAGVTLLSLRRVRPQTIRLHPEERRTPHQYYVGITSNPQARLAAHNAGLSPSTFRHRPWRSLIVIEFDDEGPAIEFERYLKTGSGREFARRHFRQLVR